MKLTLTLETPLADVIPSERVLAEAAARHGVSIAIKRHLADRDANGRSVDGMPRTGYWGDAANSVTVSMDGDTAIVSVDKEGAALHYYGGVVYPSEGHKALAIPKSPKTAGRRPAQIDPMRTRFALVWPKGHTAGTLRDRKTGEIAYLLVAKATIKADKTVLPTEDEMRQAGIAAMESIL